MTRLRVREPDILTRVTEYVPEIVAFVAQIVKNGYAYELDGSIYFDTKVFDTTEGHDYAKLEPWSKGNRKLVEEGEGKSPKDWTDPLQNHHLTCYSPPPFLRCTVR